MSAPATRISVERVGTEAGLDALGPAWDALLADTAGGSLFQTWAWTRTWWETLRGARRLHVLVARDAAGALAGIAPWMVGDALPGFPRRLRALLWIGQQGETLAEQLGPLVRRGLERVVAEAFVGSLLGDARPGFDIVLLERMREDAPGVEAIRAAFGGSGRRLRVACVQDSPYLPLPASWSALEGGWSRNFRAQVRTSRRRLEGGGPVAVLRAGEQVGLDEAMDALIRLHRARWGPDEGSFRTEPYVTFHRRLARRLLEEGRLLLLLLTVAGVPVAARYEFLHDRRIWCFQGGWDPAWERARAGTVLTAEVLRWGIENGYEEYDFLSGDEGYKRRWTDRSRRLIDLLVWGPGARAWRHGAMWRAKAAVKRRLGRAPA